MAEWKEIASYLWIGLLGLIKILWDKQEDRFKKGENRLELIEDKMQTKAASKERAIEVDKVLEDRRTGEIALHQKIEREADKTDDRFNQLTQTMHAGFSEIKTILLNQHRK